MSKIIKSPLREKEVPTTSIEHEVEGEGMVVTMPDIVVLEEWLRQKEDIMYQLQNRVQVMMQMMPSFMRGLEVPKVTTEYISTSQQVEEVVIPIIIAPSPITAQVPTLPPPILPTLPL